uniref:CID domain-containing protein n=1 Tax=Meloidogyne enterolobii TaxID=390850 RepID=A0A6V7VSR7_MELEN|nr:unnamed protein product [Meloidogyne enterolobii]
MQGDDRTKWRLDKFKMFEGGSWWQPPPHALFELGMPPQLYNTAYVPKRRRSNDKKQANNVHKRSSSTEKKIGEEKEETDESKERVERRKKALKNIAEKEEQRKRLKGVLNDQSREELENLLRNLTPEKIAIGDAMVWCLDHAECSKEITQCIFESLCIKETPLHRKIARIYLVSDILANCAVRVKDAFYYRQHFGDYLLKIFSELNEALDSIESRLKAEQFRQRVMLCFRNWEDHAVYPTQDLIKWQNVFLGLLKTDGGVDSSIDGEPIPQEEDEDLDGLPIQEEDDDIDGMPMPDDVGSDGDLDGIPIVNDEEDDSKRFTTGSWSTLEPVEQKFGDIQHARSKWESIEISRWEQQQNAITDNKNNSKLKAFDSEEGYHDDRTDRKRCRLSKLTPSPEPKESKNHITASNSNDDEERRQMLREIEIKVMKLQDKLEADGNTLQSEMDLEVSKYRQKLVQRMEEKLGTIQHRRRHSPSRSDSKQHPRENSPIHSRESETRQHRRERSRSPIRTSRRHRRSPDRSRYRGSPVRHTASRRH